MKFRHAVIATVAWGAFAGCIAMPGHGKTITNNIFYHNQAEADQDLGQFDKKNPKCPLWTNWQKLCSRRNGAPICKIDKRFRAKPSTPFCITSIGNYSDYQLEARSLMRFCKESGYVTKASSKKRFSACSEYRVNRPFNGRDIDLLRSPACQEWSEVTTEKLVCKESDGSCSKNLYSKRGFYCSKFSNSSCDDNSLYRNIMSEKKTIIKDLMEKSPVHGSYCGD